MNATARVPFVGLSLFTFLTGCGHCEAPRAQTPAPTTATTQDTARHEAESRAPAPVQPESFEHDDMDPNADADAEEHEPLSSIMSDHFYIAAWARDTVVYGDIDALREPLASLAHYQYPPEMPAGVSELQAAAALTAKADNLAAAAAGIAAMARVCGECHRKLGLGIVAKQRPIDTSTPNKVDAISGRMFRHGWAAERLWEGLVAPSDQAWTAGAAALAHAPMRTPKTKQPVTEKFAQSLRAIRDLGAKASIATSMEERTNIYAQTLATCAQCHADNVVFASKR